MPEGIDNSTFIESLTNKDVLGNDRLKMSLIYFLTILIPGSWEKIYALNILSSSVLIIFFRKIFKDLKRKVTSNYLILLYLIYILSIVPPLILVHLKQYLSLGFCSILIYLYSINNKRVLKYEIVVSILIIFSHIVYFPFILSYFLIKYFSNKILNIWIRSSLISRIFYLLIACFYIILSFISIDTIFKTVSLIIPGYYTYGIQEIIGSGNQKFISCLYPFILIIPIILFKFLGRDIPKKGREHFLITLFLYLMVCIPISIVEFKLPLLYAIGRLKTGIYPLIFILLYDLKEVKISKKNVLPIIFLSYIICAHALYRTNQYLIPNL